MLKKFILSPLVLVLAGGLSGCSSLAVMEKSVYVEKSADQSALINIVRPHIFLGDGVDFEVWDGQDFIGTLASGKIIQYQASAGAHCIMIDPTQGGNWAVLKIDAKENATYFVKPNTIPFVGLKLGLASEGDSRKEEWAKNLTPMKINTAKSKPVPDEAVAKAKQFANNCL